MEVVSSRRVSHPNEAHCKHFFFFGIRTHQLELYILLVCSHTLIAMTAFTLELNNYIRPLNNYFDFT